MGALFTVDLSTIAGWAWKKEKKKEKKLKTWTRNTSKPHISIQTDTYSLPHRVIFYIIVFDSLMIYMISSKIYGALDIIKHNSMILLQTKITNQIL